MFRKFFKNNRIEKRLWLDEKLQKNFEGIQEEFEEIFTRNKNLRQSEISALFFVLHQGEQLIIA